MTKLISVVVPHYPSESRKPLLVRSLRALSTQSLSKLYYEIIVVIDGVENKLVKYLNNEFSEIIVLTKKHTGVCQTRNLGINFSQAKYIAFIDDDCVPETKWLENYLSFIKKKPNARAIGGKISSISNKTVFQRYAIKRKLLLKPIYLNNTIVSLITANVLIKRDILNKIGGFETIYDSMFKSCGGEDADLSYKLRKKGINLDYCDSAVVFHFHRDVLTSFIKQQYRNGKGIIVHSIYRNIPINELGFPEPRIIYIIFHLLQYIFINKDGSPSLLSRTKSYFFDSNLNIGDKFLFPLIDVLRRVCYYLGIYFGNRKF